MTITSKKDIKPHTVVMLEDQIFDFLSTRECRT